MSNRFSALSIALLMSVSPSVARADAGNRENSEVRNFSYTPTKGIKISYSCQKYTVSKDTAIHIGDFMKAATESSNGILVIQRQGLAMSITHKWKDGARVHTTVGKTNMEQHCTRNICPYVQPLWSIERVQELFKQVGEECEALANKDMASWRKLTSLGHRPLPARLPTDINPR